MRKILWMGLVLAMPAAGQWLETYLNRPVLGPRQTLLETQLNLAARVKPMPAIGDRAAWETYAATLREQLLSQVVFRGEAAAWRTMPTREVWVDTLPGNGYKLRRFRYEVVPGLWLPGYLYEPEKLEGRVPVVINLNGHEGEGAGRSYIQERCINLARKGMLAYNFEWFMKGQMSGDGYAHGRLNQLDLTGTSGIAPFILAQTRLVDIALKHPNADAERVAATGLSGGGCQTIWLSALDTRIKVVMPVAGYSSYVTRAQFPEPDLGDSEQTPADSGVFADYTHLTALLAPRPSLLTHNAYDDCCFRAEYAAAPLLVAARPFFSLYGKEENLRYHENFDRGHNYGLDNREALYGLLKEFFYAGKEFSAEEIPVAAELRPLTDYRVPLPENNESLHSLAVKLAADLPHPGGASRSKLREVLRWPEYRVTSKLAWSGKQDGVDVRGWRLLMNGIWTVPVVEFDPPGASGTTMVLADGGRASLATEIGELIARKQRVVAIDPWYFGESRLASRDYLFALLASAVGERPLGIEAAQVAAACRALVRRDEPITVAAYGPRTSIIALVAAAEEETAIAGLKLTRPMSSLKEVLERDLLVEDAPELFTFGLLERFDVPQLRALVKPRPIE
ncbi:MAG: acetylxylan esterase [Bryobacteraceae bacterium]